MRILHLCLFTLIFISTMPGQLQIKLSFSRTDSLGDTQTAYYGVDQRATNCIDTSLGEHEIWWQACGLVPCLAFIDVRTVSGYCLGAGTTVDLRPFYSTSQVDTYRLKFDGYLPIVFHWQSNISDYYGAMTLMNNRDTNLATVKINMLAQDSFVVTSYLSGFPWHIRAESPSPVTGVKLHDGSYPTTPSLLQNYPNPFNPSTVVGFTLTHEAAVTITVYDVLGREVKTLTRDQTFTQGEHTLNLSANDLSSGMYFYKLTASSVKTGFPEYSNVKKMIICR